MPNTKSLHLCHALTGEAKRKYNVKYYAENKDYWPEWRKKMQLNAMTGAEKKNSGEEVSGISGDSKLGSAIRSATRYKAGDISTDGKRVANAVEKLQRLENGTTASSFYSKYYGTAQYRGSNPTAREAYSRAVQKKLREAEEKQRLEQEKRIRIRNRIASVYKLEWAEAQKRAQRPLNRIVSKVKDALSTIKMSVVEAYHLGKK